jgi:hypothetical protein
MWVDFFGINGGFHVDDDRQQTEGLTVNHYCT